MTTLPQPSGTSTEPRTSGLAIASLICSIAGVCGGVTAIVGLILGIVALVKIRKSQGQLRGSGLAGAGIVISILMIALYLVVIAVGVPSGMRAAYTAAAQANVKQLCVANLAYADANRGTLPSGDSWDQVLVSKGYVTATVFQYPPAAGRGFAMNTRLSGLALSQIKNRSTTVLFFECAPGSPPAGGPELLPPKPRGSEGYVVGYCDGHVETVPPEQVKNLRWEP